MQNHVSPAPPLGQIDALESQKNEKIHENIRRQELIVAISKSIQLDDDLIEISSFLAQVKDKTPGNLAAILVLTNLLDRFYKRQNRAQDQIDEIKRKMT